MVSLKPTLKKNMGEKKEKMLLVRQTNPSLPIQQQLTTTPTFPRPEGFAAGKKGKDEGAFFGSPQAATFLDGSRK